jgi:hypothetical protein
LVIGQAMSYGMIVVGLAIADLGRPGIFAPNMTVCLASATADVRGRIWGGLITSFSLG